MKRTILFLLCVIFGLAGCVSGTKLVKQALPLGLSSKEIKGIEFSVLNFGTTKDWSELEIAIANNLDKPVPIKVNKIYILGERGYYSEPYDHGQIREHIEAKTGKLVNPLTLSALTAGITAIILPHGKPKEIAKDAAIVLGAGAVANEVILRQKVQEDKLYVGDFGLKNKDIPQKLKIGGTVYYPPVKKLVGVKAYIHIEGKEEIFQINFK
ncbi:MAG: hypothetical protein V1674_00845 [Candidatus Omnitrophota bacterium]